MSSSSSWETYNNTSNNSSGLNAVAANTSAADGSTPSVAHGNGPGISVPQQSEVARGASLLQQQQPQSLPSYPPAPSAYLHHHNPYPHQHQLHQLQSPNQYHGPQVSSS